MKKTKYKVYASWGGSTGWKRVYTDENGKRYIRGKYGYKCIEGTPCLFPLVADEEEDK